MQVKPAPVEQGAARRRLQRIARTGPYYRVRREADGRYLVFSRPSRAYYLTDAIGAALFEQALPGRTIQEVIRAVAVKNSVDERTLDSDARVMFASMESCPEVPLDFRLSGPLRAGWRLTERCNLKCLHCFNSMSEPREMDATGVDRVIDEVRAAGVFELVLSGGEPLLHADIARIVHRIGDLGLTIFTNGTMLDRRLAELADHDIRFMVSLDGFEAEHDRLRGAGSWMRAMAGIEQLEAGGFLVTINCVVSALNLDTVEAFIDHHRARGRHVQVSFIVPIGNAQDNAHLALREHHRAQLDAVLSRYRPGGGGVGEQRFICGGGRTKVDIRTDGKVVPCSFTDAFELGDLGCNTLAEIWASPARGEFHAFLGPEVLSGSCRVVREAYGESFAI